MKTELNGSIFERYGVHMFVLQCRITLLQAMAWCEWHMPMVCGFVWVCVGGAGGRRLCPHVGWWRKNTPVKKNIGVWSPRCTNTAYQKYMSFASTVHLWETQESSICGTMEDVCEACSCAYIISKGHTRLHKLLYPNYSASPSPHGEAEMTKHENKLLYQL